MSTSTKAPARALQRYFLLQAFGIGPSRSSKLLSFRGIHSALGAVLVIGGLLTLISGHQPIFEDPDQIGQACFVLAAGNLTAWLMITLVKAWYTGMPERQVYQDQTGNTVKPVRA